MHWHNT